MMEFIKRLHEHSADYDMYEAMDGDKSVGVFSVASNICPCCNETNFLVSLVGMHDIEVLRASLEFVERLAADADTSAAVVVDPVDEREDAIMNALRTLGYKVRTAKTLAVDGYERYFFAKPGSKEHGR